jgi:hypothetical protein
VEKPAPDLCKKASTHSLGKETAHTLCIYLCLTPKNAQKTCVETDDRRTDLKPIVLAPTPGLVAGLAHQNIPVDSMPKSQRVNAQNFTEIS